MRMSDDGQVNVPAASGRPIDLAVTRLLAQGLRHEACDGFTVAEDFFPAKTELLEHQVRLRTEELERSNRETLRTLVRVAACRDDESGAHVKRIGLYAAHLAQRMGLDAEYCALISLASQLHDIGKIGVPDLILKKRGALHAGEWRVMRAQCTLGASMLAHSSTAPATSRPACAC